MTIVGSVASAWIEEALGDGVKASGSFSVAVGDLLVACLDGSGTVSIADSQGGSWSSGVSFAGGTDKILYRMITTAASITVTYTSSGDTTWIEGTVLKFTGAKSTIGATGTGSSATNNLTASIFTSTVANSFTVVFGIDGNSNGAATSSDLTINQATNSLLGYQYVSGYKALGSVGAETANLNAGGAGAADWNWGAIEVLEAVGAPPPQQMFPNRIWRGRRR